MIENFMEGYHLSPLHRTTLHPMNPTRLCTHFPPGEAYFGYNAGFSPDLPRSYKGHPDLSDAEAKNCVMFGVPPGLVSGCSGDYSWNATSGLYVAVLGAGSALDTIARNGDGTYTWTDGASGAKENYQAGTFGRITSSVDTCGNGLSYSYDGSNLLVRITSSDGESVGYSYVGRNLAQVTTTLATGQVNQVSYTFE